MALDAYEDPSHEGNSSAHHTGKPCIEAGCGEPAGTAWGDYWCFRCNVKRMKRITGKLEALAAGEEL